MSERGAAPVCVVIPHYNDSSGLHRCLTAIVNQSCVPAQVVIVDDGSSRDELVAAQAVVDELGRAGAMEFVQLGKNGGPGAARNAGVRLARQPFVAFIDSDDWWSVEKISVQYRWMAARPAVSMTCHPVILPGARPIRRRAPRRVFLVDLLIRNSVATSSVMLRKEIIEHNEFPNRYHSEDYETWLRVASGGEIWDLGCPHGFHARGAGHSGLSAASWSMERGELHSLWRAYRTGLIPSPIYAMASVWSVLKFVARGVRRSD